MNNPAASRRCVIAQLHWLIETPTSSPTAGLTCYREELGPSDLFSVFVKFESSAPQGGSWERAKIFALVEEMEPRLPSKGGRLVLTAGPKSVAVAEVLSECDEAV